MDEFFELLTLVQTGKSKKHMPVILYGSDYWRQVINFDNMLRWGTIDKEDMKLFKIVDDVEEAFEYLKGYIEKFNLRAIRK
jgi:predicted Rossmann-fold nucleotide-binding protein